MRTLCRLPFRPLSIKVTEYLNVNRSCVCFVFSSGDRTQALNITDNCYITKLPYLNHRPKTSHYIYTNISLPCPRKKKKIPSTLKILLVPRISDQGHSPAFCRVWVSHTGFEDTGGKVLAYFSTCLYKPVI